MIPGAGAIGQYPNLSLGLPLSRAGRSATVKIFPKYKATARIQPLKLMKLTKFPQSR